MNVAKFILVLTTVMTSLVVSAQPRCENNELTIKGEELMAIVREKSTCAIILHGTDGEDICKGSLKDISSRSVSYEIEGVLYSITKK